MKVGKTCKVVVSVQVDPSRRICDAVAGGELDVAIIGGDIPLELADTLAAVPYAQASEPLQPTQVMHPLSSSPPRRELKKIHGHTTIHC